MSALQAKKLFFDSLKQLYNSSDKKLIESGQERASIAALMCHMRCLISSYSLPSCISIDCEYHRSGNINFQTKRNVRGRPRTPDLLVHERENHSYNYVMAEFKSWRAKKPFRRYIHKDILCDDREKIDLLNRSIRYEFSFVVLLAKEKPHIELYKGPNPLGGLPDFEVVSW